MYSFKGGDIMLRLRDYQRSEQGVSRYRTVFHVTIDQNTIDYLMFNDFTRSISQITEEN